MPVVFFCLDGIASLVNSLSLWLSVILAKNLGKTIWLNDVCVFKIARKVLISMTSL